MAIFLNRAPKAKQAANIAQNAINMFTTASSQLQKSNELAEQAIEENAAEMQRLKDESNIMVTNISQNEVIIGNIEKFLGVTKESDEEKDSPA